MKIGFIIDSPQAINKQKDTSYFLMTAALERGHQVFHFDQNTISYSEGQVSALIEQMTEAYTWPHGDGINHLGRQSLTDMDLIFIRKDPPFDRRYFYTTLMLDLLPKKVKVVNRPSGLRDWNEKISSLFYSEFCPTTLISSDFAEMSDFVQKVKKAVIKPIDGFGGRGIVMTDSSQFNRETFDKVTVSGSHKVIVQKFVEEANLGDKRILIFKGRPLGGILRVAAKPGGLNNLDQGGKAVATDLSARDLAVCEILRQDLIDNGLDFVGIDMLGPYLTEINVTSPTGLQEMSRFHQSDFHHQIIAEYERG